MAAKKVKYQSIGDYISSLVEYDYDTKRDCDEHGCDTICRCAQITNTEITDFYPDYAYGSIKDGYSYKIESVRDYCLHRFVSRSLSTGDFSIGVIGGYYGEECEVEMNEGARSNISTFVDRLNNNSVSDSDLMEECLLLEYSYVLPSLKNKEWVFKKDVPLTDISLGDQMYRVDPQTVKKYQGSQINKTCLCLSDGRKYRLIDGYHRMSAALKNKEKTIDVIYTLEK